MAIPPIPPPGLGPEAQIGSIGGLGAEAQVVAPPTETEGFGKMLVGQVEDLNQIQSQADSLQKAMAAGEDVDITQVVVAAERAQLSMQLATQMRNQLVNAYNELLRTQI